MFHNSCRFLCFTIVGNDVTIYNFNFLTVCQVGGTNSPFSTVFNYATNT
jgi:hypothetical protein